MSAQAVLSMIVSGLPTNPRGPSGGEGATGFRGLLAELGWSNGDEGVDSPTQPARPGVAERKSVDDGSQPLILPGSGEPREPEPQILPGAAAGKDVESLVLPGVVDAKTQEPQVLPGIETKDAEPLILPGAAAAKESQPQVLPGTSPGKPPEPLILPDGLAAKGLGRQVQPGATDDKAPGPRVLPGSDGMEVAPPAPEADDAAGGALRPGAGQAQVHTLQPVPPPARPLTERTSRPLDEPRIAPSPSATDARTTAPTTPPVSAPSEQPAKPAPQALLTPAAPQTDASVAAPDEGPSNGGPAAGASEAAAPAREHNLSTLSRASIDATAQIAAQIQRRLEGRSTRFEIALRPAELGRVDVKLDIDAEGRLAARLAFDNPAAATDLRGRVDDLRRQLEAAGFELAEDAFEFAERDSGSSAFDRGQDARHGQNRAFAAAARLKTEIDVAQPPQWLALTLSPSGVDMKV